ncbi:hypothetical protein JHK86_052342 [Glycine max]|nr:hypothetical protein JHK86_052342 [Glycine max]
MRDLPRPFGIEEIFENTKNMVEANNIMQNMAWGSASSSHIPSQITPTPNNNGRVYVANPINQFDGASKHGMNMQQINACFGYIPTMAQESTNSTSSYPRQFNCLQNIPQSQPIFEDLKPLDYKNEMVDFSYQVDVPLDSTNQLGVYADWTNNQFGDFEDWINRPIDWSNQPVNGDLVARGSLGHVAFVGIFRDHLGGALGCFASYIGPNSPLCRAFCCYYSSSRDGQG